MASNSFLTLVLGVACFVSLISPAISQRCSAQNVSGDFDSCVDLPSLESYLHYTYNASNSSLSVAFVATPSRTGDWVAWAINPTGTRMLGSQAFLAYSPRAGARPEVNTYNITSYVLTPGRLSFESWNLRAESMDSNRIVIYASVKVPAGAESVNQVWQRGGNVTDGRVGGHPMEAANMASRGVLRLTGSDGPSSAPGPAAGGGGSTTPGGPRSAGSMSTSVNFGVNFGILVMLATIFIF